VRGLIDENVVDPPTADAMRELAFEVRRLLKITRQKVKEFICPMINGGHEYYRTRGDQRYFQECLLCKRQTIGWDLRRSNIRLIASQGKRIR
jgi:hypothetical protein